MTMNIFIIKMGGCVQKNSELKVNPFGLNLAPKCTETNTPTQHNLLKHIVEYNYGHAVVSRFSTTIALHASMHEQNNLNQERKTFLIVRHVAPS